MLLDEIRRRIAPILERKGVKKAILFGSYERGTADNRSDVDLIIVDDQEQRYLDRLDKCFAEISEALSAPVDLFVYTPTELDRMADRPFVERALREGVTLFERWEARAGSRPLAFPGQSRPQGGRADRADRGADARRHLVTPAFDGRNPASGRVFARRFSDIA